MNTTKQLLKESILHEIEKDQAIENKENENNKQLEFYCVYELPEELENELYSKEEIENNDFLSIFEGDPDYIEYDWEIIYFMKYKDYVLVSDFYDNWQLENVLSKFFQNDFEKYFIDLDKNDYENFDWYRIAYRWYSWYFYGLWWYKDN